MRSALALALMLSVALPAPAADGFKLTIHYLTREYPQPLPLSLRLERAEDEGLMGARLANEENQLTGRFLGQEYELVEHILPLDAPFPDAGLAAIEGGARFVVADLEADDLLALAQHPEAADDVLLSTRAHDDRLRLVDCRANVWHVAPSWAMKADGLAQYLAWKRWDEWFLVHGKTPDDVAYAEALERAAAKFGAEIVERRDYAFEAGSRRVESGHQQIQTQMPSMTQGAPDHDVVVVADAAEAFGEYLLYRTFDARPVVGTHGLVSDAWHPAFEQFGSMSLHSAFEKLAERPITSRDYVNWLAVKTVAEPAVRLKTTDPDAITAEFLNPEFKQPGFKGIGLNFRSWNQQMRQPLLIAWARAMVSMSPQDGFLHERHTLDSLGLDRSDSECRLNQGE
ncbi:MAG: hypothetical protein AAFR84_15445 [Pseudomonadota bacterium]